MQRPQHGALGLAFIACRALQLICLIAVMGMTAKFISDMVDSMESPPQPLIAILSIVCFAVLYCLITFILYWDSQIPLIATAICDGLFFLALMISSIIIGKPLSYQSCKANLGSAVASAATSVASAANVAVQTAYTTTTSTIGAASETVAAQNFNVVTQYAEAAAATPTVNPLATLAATVSPSATAVVKGSDGNTYRIIGEKIKRDVGDALSSTNYEDWVVSSKSTCMMMKAIWGFGIALTIIFLFSLACLLFLWKNQRVPKPKGEKSVNSDSEA